MNTREFRLATDYIPADIPDRLLWKHRDAIEAMYHRLAAGGVTDEWMGDAQALIARLRVEAADR